LSLSLIFLTGFKTPSLIYHPATALFYLLHA